MPQTLVQAWAEVSARLLRLPRSDSEGAWIQRAVATAESDLVELWQAYTLERRNLNARLLATRGSVAAYVLGFHLVNAARAELVLHRAQQRWPIDEMLGEGPLHVLDLGAGSGAASQIAALHLARGQRDLHVELFDQNRSLLEAAGEIFGHLDLPGLRLAVHRTPLHEVRVRDGSNLASSGGSALVVLSFVWNELQRLIPARDKVLAQLRALAESSSPGLFLLLEPANQTPCRHAMELHDELLRLSLHALYPCPAATACPLLQRARDWCYSEARWQRPPAQLVVDQALEVDRGRLSVTGILFANRAAVGRVHALTPRGPVVVGRPTRQGSTEVQYLLCHGDHVETRTAGPGPLLERGRVLPSRPPT